MNRLSAAVVSGFLLMVVACWVGCDPILSRIKDDPADPAQTRRYHAQGERNITCLYPNGRGFSGVRPRPHSIADKTGPDKTGAVPLNSGTEKGAEETRKEADEPRGPPQRGEFTIQIGAYIIDENLIACKERTHLSGLLSL